MLCRGMIVKDSFGRNRRMAGSITDITGGKVADALTGLPNRLLFTERLKGCFDEYRRNPNQQCAVLYLDLDNFKYINDTFGHGAGERVLMNAARRLESVIRIDDAVAARFGGDEFAVLLESIPDVSVAVQVAHRIREALATPLLFEGREVFTQVSVGIVVIDGSMQCVDDLLRQADIAMYDAKSQGKCRTSVFNPAMHARSEARYKMETELRLGISRDEFLLHFQPIVELRTARLVGFEAMIRWRHPTLGLVSPLDFIPLAEEIGIILPLGKWVLTEACRQIAACRAQFPRMKDLQVNINISSKQLSQEGFVDETLATIKHFDLEGSAIKLELTESVIMKNPGQVSQMLEAFRHCGVRIAIDDFGTGFSSLAYLHQLPLDVLKIDRSFIQHLENSDHADAIVRTILSLASNLGLEVVAEGIETREQYQELTRLGCQFAQGYFMSRPVAADEATRLIESLDETGALPEIQQRLNKLPLDNSSI